MSEVAAVRSGHSAVACFDAVQPIEIVAELKGRKAIRCIASIHSAFILIERQVLTEMAQIGVVGWGLLRSEVAAVVVEQRFLWKHRLLRCIVQVELLKHYRNVTTLGGMSL